MTGWAWAGAILLISLIATAIDIDTERPCERDYRTVYVHRDTPSDIGIRRYCRTVNSGPVDPYGLHN